MISIRFQFPNFTEQDAARFAHEWYGLQTAVRPLPSERDQNFHLKTEDGREFVLKIANAAEQRETLDLQHKALEHLAAQAPALSLPRVCATTDGKTIATINSNGEATFFLRLLTWVPGTLLAHVKPHRPDLWRSFGSALGTIDRALQDFDHPAAHRSLKWDLKQAHWIRDYLHYIEQPARRAMIEQCLSQFELEVAPLLSALRASVIHNDANDYNVLVSDADLRAELERLS